MRLPKAHPARAQLLESALRINEIAVPHFFADDEDALYLGLDVHREGLNANAVRSLVFGLVSVAQDRYPALFRRVTREDVLASLETAYKRSA